MQFVTLTTDFGTQDFYVGALKGALLSRCHSLQLVDVSHDISPFDIVQGAFVLRNVWPTFPAGSIHLLGVHCVYDAGYRFVAARHHGHYFLAPDNGLLSLLFDSIEPTDLRNLPADPAEHFAVKKYLPTQRPIWPKAAHLKNLGNTLRHSCNASASSRSSRLPASGAP